ncbi:MAG: sulfur-carrier protein adenylyltransferase/sulfurtransferase [Solirubrobacterales bacterium]|jgi:molybdopterin/thiamine biosynthesis adenylyltransferase/rhodanese-related sulfurtransferase|nr:sulfur-carrier protein adenylyltransferase/sulfurtransferase [Solirubrobacterales bacterium]
MAVKEPLELVRSQIRELNPVEAKEALDADSGIALIDTREPHEYEEAHLEGATLIPPALVGQDIGAKVPDRSKPLIVYCRTGNRSAYAVKQLQDLGYEDVASMSGGIELWQDLGLPVAAAEGMTAEQRERYSRHTLLPEVGVPGQLKMLDAKVLLIGAGGLGSPTALYLAAAGIGTIGLVDDDAVDASNLQRQVIHTTDRVGMAKTSSAKLTIEALNPDVEVVEHNLRLDAGNVLELLEPYDVIVDGADNFPTRYLLNDASVRLRKPVVSASILSFDGQISTFVPYEGPCYRCLYPSPPPPELAPSCSAAGVLGVMAGVVGLLQANEVIKLVTGIGEPLIGRLLLYEALGTRFTELKVRRDPECPICGENAPEIAEADLGKFPDYEAFCRG